MSHDPSQPGIVADGLNRLERAPQFQMRLRELRKTIAHRHAAELAAAGLFGRLAIRWRMFREYRRERKKTIPSPASCYGCSH
jgi:hypothetical protein